MWLHSLVACTVLVMSNNMITNNKLMMKRQKLLLLMLLLASVATAHNVKVEFFTPGIVHVVKFPTADSKQHQSLVVTAQPEQVALKTKGNQTQSSELTVRLDSKTGCLTFLTAKGKVLLREQSHRFEPAVSEARHLCLTRMKPFMVLALSRMER